MLKSLNLLDQLNKDGSILPGTTSKSEAQTVEEFSAGNIGMLISHSGQILTVTKRNPDLDFGIIAIPSYDGQGTPELRHHGWDVAISANSEHKEEAWKFISYMTNKENETKMSDQMLKIPSMRDVDVSYTDQYPQVKDAMDYMDKYDMVEELMEMPKSGSCWVELTKAGSQVMQGKLTPEDAISQVQAAWDKILNQ